jgi:CDP-2,3-bis-(O-geranylgeranyl)-sn-glycerol synthase
MAGDSAKSFLKRRRGIPPGESWVPFDQLDFVIGSLILTWRQARLSWVDGVLILAFSAGGHVLVNHLGYWLGIRDTRW